MGTFAVHPAADKLNAAPHIVLRQELIRRLSRFLPPFMLSPILASIAALTFCPTSVASPLETLELALSLITVGITIAINAPLNRRFARWSPEAVPRDWESQIQRWNLAHSARMMTALVAFASAIFAVR